MELDASRKSKVVLDGNIWHLIIRELYIQHEATEEEHQHGEFRPGRVPAEFRSWLLKLRSTSRELYQVVTPFAYWELSLAGEKRISATNHCEREAVRMCMENIYQHTRNLILDSRCELTTGKQIPMLIHYCQKLRSIVITGINDHDNDPLPLMGYLTAFAKKNPRMFYRTTPLEVHIGVPQLEVEEIKGNHFRRGFPAQHSLADLRSTRNPSQPIISTNSHVMHVNKLHYDRPPILELLSIHGIPTKALSSRQRNSIKFCPVVDLQLDISAQDLSRCGVEPTFYDWNFSLLRFLSLTADILPLFMESIDIMKFPKLESLRIIHSREVNLFHLSQHATLHNLSLWLQTVPTLDSLELEFTLSTWYEVEALYWLTTLPGLNLKRLSIGGNMASKMPIGRGISCIRRRCPNVEFLRLSLLYVKDEELDIMAEELSFMASLLKLELELVFVFADKGELQARKNVVMTFMDKVRCVKAGHLYSSASLYMFVMMSSTHPTGYSNTVAFRCVFYTYGNAQLSVDGDYQEGQWVSVAYNPDTRAVMDAVQQSTAAEL